MDWKKEIKVSDLLRRQGEGGQTAPQPGSGSSEGSVWKKEIKLSALFRRRRSSTTSREQLALPLPGDTVPEAPSASAPLPVDESEKPAEVPGWSVVEPGEPSANAEDPTSTAGPESPPPGADESHGTSTEPVVSVGEPDPAEPVAGVQPAPSTPQQKPSVWKRDVSFGRKSKKAATASAAIAAGEAEAAAAPAPKTSIWKKNPSGRKKTNQSPSGARPIRRDDQPDVREPRPHAGPERAPRSGSKLPDVPLMKAMNLLPKDAQLAATKLRPGVVQAAAVVVALLLVGGVALFYKAGKDRVAEKEAVLADKSAELEALQAQQLPSESDDTALAGESLARATALSGALEGRMNWDRVLRELSLTLPENVWFESFLTTAPVLPTPVDGTTTAPVAVAGLPAGTTLTINGYAGSQADVGYLLSRLSVIPEFASVQLAQSGRTEIGAEQVVKFTVIGTLKRPGEAMQTTETAGAQTDGEVTR